MAHWASIDEVDLRQVARKLAATFEQHPPVGYLRGKTAMRNALEQSLDCSELEAEELVDTLESRGFLRFDGDPAAPSEADAAWGIDYHRKE